MQLSYGHSRTIWRFLPLLAFQASQVSGVEGEDTNTLANLLMLANPISGWQVSGSSFGSPAKVRPSPVTRRPLPVMKLEGEQPKKLQRSVHPAKRFLNSVNAQGLAMSIALYSALPAMADIYGASGARASFDTVIDDSDFDLVTFIFRLFFPFGWFPASIWLCIVLGYIDNPLTKRNRRLAGEAFEAVTSNFEKPWPAGYMGLGKKLDPNDMVSRGLEDAEDEFDEMPPPFTYEQPEEEKPEEKKRSREV